MGAKPSRWFGASLLLAVLPALVNPSLASESPQKTLTLQGKVVGANDAAIPEASCTLLGGLLPATGLTVKTDHRGEFRFLELSPAAYTLTCAAMGYRPVKKTFEFSQALPYVEMLLPPDVVLRQEVNVRAKAPILGREQSAPPAQLTSQEIIDLPMTEQKFKAVLPLIPGVIRTPDGRINIKGVPENQGLLLVNSAETVDPVTGSFSIDVPLQAVESVQVFKNAYRANYGGFSGGLTTVYTKPPASQWHFELEDVTPNPRIKAGHLVGIADYNPRFYLTGPFLSNHLNFSEALAYDMDKQPVRGLAWPKNEIKSHDFNSYTTLQWVLSPTHILSVNAHVFPLVRQFANISSLVLQPASSDYGQKGFSLGLTDRYLARSGGVLTTVIAGQRFDSNAHGQGAEDMLVTPTGWGGNFFNAFRRDSEQEELRETYDLPKTAWHGNHEWTVGGGILRRAYTGSSRSHPVEVLRSDGTLTERIDFLGPGRMKAQDFEGALFAQDHWTLTDRLAIDLGLRYSGQTLGSTWNFGPRLGVVYSPGSGGKTVLRSGFGVFYDHTPLLAGDFPGNPLRMISLFDSAENLQGPPQVFQNFYGRTDEGKGLELSMLPLHSTPSNLTWSLEADRELRPNLMLRVSYLASRTADQYVVNPLPSLASGPALVLVNSGDSSYREFEVTLHARPTAHSEWNISYVNSRARGDLNGLSQVYVPFEQPVIRPNAYASLPSDIPNRLITWGRFRTHIWGIFAGPVLDWHSGFPYSWVDARQNYVGRPNTHRFPRFFSIDLKLGKEFRLPFPWIKNHLLRGALTIFNITNNDNPRDIYNNITSPIFGHYAGFQHYFFDTSLDILY
jgi:hypothetical protein